MAYVPLFTKLSECLPVWFVSTVELLLRNIDRRVACLRAELCLQLYSTCTQMFYLEPVAAGLSKQVIFVVANKQAYLFCDSVSLLRTLQALSNAASCGA